MKAKASTNSCPLFPEQPDVWESLDSQTQQEVEYLIVKLLATHIEPPVTDSNELTNTKEHQL